MGGFGEKGGGCLLTSLVDLYGGLGGRLLARRVDGEGRMMDISGWGGGGGRIESMENWNLLERRRLKTKLTPWLAKE